MGKQAIVLIVTPESIPPGCFHWPACCWGGSLAGFCRQRLRRGCDWFDLSLRRGLMRCSQVRRLGLSKSRRLSYHETSMGIFWSFRVPCSSTWSIAKILPTNASHTLPVCLLASALKMSTSALVKQSSRINTQEVPHIETVLTSKQDTQEHCGSWSTNLVDWPINVRWIANSTDN